MTTRSSRSRRSIGAAVLMFAAVLAVLAPAPAWAHAALVGSSPHEDEQLAELPAQVRLEFTEEMSSPAYVIVTAPGGTTVTAGDPQVDGVMISNDITDGPDGTYTMAYRAVSVDGHPVTGEIAFSVGAAGETTGLPEPDPSAAEPDQATSSSNDAAPAPPADETLLSRHLLAVSVGAILFLLAALMLILARRTAP